MTQTRCIDSLHELVEGLHQGALSSWDALMQADPTATFFQSPGWCLEWYRCYHAVFQPLVMAVTCGEVLVGVVPLAVERSTRRLTFASDEMSDYRDVVAAPEYRRAVVGELFRLCRRVNSPSPLQLGPMQPESDTLAIALALSGSRAGPRIILRSHPSWRWWFTDSAAVKALTNKKSVRQPLSHYRREGPLNLERIETSEAWEGIKHEFFDQHSLRQIYTDRPLSFTDPRKQAFYGALLRNHPSSMHVTALRAGGRLLAMHYGYTSKDVLYWGAPAFDITEEKHSPGQVLLALVFQSAAANGLRGVDLTLGIEDYKKRFSNEHVDLPTLEVYARARRYYARRLRDEAVSIAKASLVKWRGPQAWERLRHLFGLIGTRGQGLWTLAKAMGGRAKDAMLTNRKQFIFAATPTDIVAVTPRQAAEEGYECRTDTVSDLLKWKPGDTRTATRAAQTVKRAPEALRSGHMLHTLLRNNQLVGWGWSCVPREPVALLDTNTSFDVQRNSMWLHDFYIGPESRSRQAHLAALLASIVKERVAQGAERAYIVCTAKDTLLRALIEQVGFRLVRIDRLSRVLGRERVTSRRYVSL